MEKEKNMNKANKSKVFAVICSSLMLFCSIFFIIYTLLFCNDNVNNTFLIISSLLVFIFTFIITITSLVQKRKLKNILLGISSVFICFFILFNVLTLANIIKLPMQDTLDNFFNKNINDILVWGEKNNIKINQIYEYSDTISEFNIISQDVSPNTLLKEVKELNLIISSGPNYEKSFILQNLVGMNIDDALNITNSNFMNNVKIDYEFNDSFEKDLIISQNKNGEIKRNDELKLIVSLGTKGELPEVEMIDLKGKSLFDADLWLKRNGINYELTYEFSDDIKRDYCISQSEKEGTTIDPNETKVTLIISKGKEILIPDFTTMSVNDATNWISENKLKIIFKEAYDNELDQGKIISSNYSINTKVEEGTTIELTISKGKLKMEEFESINEFRSWANSLELEYEENSEFNDLDKGKIISSNPKVGEYIDLNEKITITYSKGKSTTIPNFYKKTKSEANTLCNNYKLNCYYSYRYSSSVNEGYITSQSMSSGSTVAQNTSITLYISKGPEPVVQKPVNTCTSTQTHQLMMQPTWIQGGSANATISTLKAKFAEKYPKVKFIFQTKPSNEKSGFIHEDSPININSTIQDCKTYTIIINE